MDRKAVQAAMTAAFGGTDASRTWSWKQAYEVAEIALTLFLQRYGPAMLSKAGSPARMLGLPHRPRAPTDAAFLELARPVPGHAPRKLTYATLSDPR